MPLLLFALASVLYTSVHAMTLDPPGNRATPGTPGKAAGPISQPAPATIVPNLSTNPGITLSRAGTGAKSTDQGPGPWKSRP